MKMISVIIANKSKHRGELTNAGFVCGLTAGRLMADDTFGSDVVDGDGQKHAFLTRIGHMVREAGDNKIRELRKKFAENPDVILVDYTEDAAPSSYEKYQENLAAHAGEQITYRLLHAYGPEEFLLPLTKNLSRLS
jgi:hypothetical protein